MNKTEKFMKTLLENSVSNDWDIARTEWINKKLKYSEEGLLSCICGQKNIQKGVVIKNIKNNNELLIGYNCWKSVMKMQNLDTEFKRLRNQYILQKYGIFNIPSKYTVLCNYEHYIINSWELMFLLNIIDTTYEFSIKQREILKKLINKIKLVNDSKIKVKGISFSPLKKEYKTDWNPEEPYLISFEYNDNKKYTLKRTIKLKYVDEGF